MLCSSCRRSLFSRLSYLQSSSSTVSPSASTVPSLSQTTRRTVATVPNTKPASPPSAPLKPSTNPASPSTATSSSSAPGLNQPFSEPFFPSSTAAATTTATTPPLNASANPNASAPVKLVSSCPGGTSLSSLSYVKQASKPLVAREDHEYPPWLWTLVPDPNAPAASDVSGGVDLSSMSKKNRAKYERKMAKLAATLEKPVPLHEQSKNLTEPGESAAIHMQRQKDLTQSMRGARRKGIREANFLKSM